MRKIVLFLLLILSSNIYSQKISSVERPKLVIGIVVDQMRYDFLYRYWDKYGEGGFKRLVNGGFLYKSANYNYVPTYTGPGHACIYTGTTPSINGIISNDWFDRSTGKMAYCAGDASVKPIGTDSATGKMSPGNLLSTTITDELRFATNFKSKVIGISIKDRGAILPAGHSATGAYWHDPFSNNFVTSSYYMAELPQWVKDFNRRKIVDSLLKSSWNTLLPIDTYTESTPDDNRYEGIYKGETKPIFPHNLPIIKANDDELIRRTPFGNTLLKLFAESAINGESLGNGHATDFIAISFSSTDYVGHMFGINSIETEDTYLRLDRELESFMTFLDKKIGANNYLLFLTADHGAASNFLFNQDHGIPAGRFPEKAIADSLKSHLNMLYGPGDYVQRADAHTVYLNHELIGRKKISIEELENHCISFLLDQQGVAIALPGRELRRENYKTGIAGYIQNGYHAKRSADILIELAPGWLDWNYSTGTTHGSSYSYDTHVPVIFYGWKIPKGSSAKPVNIIDIAPTLSLLLNIDNPNGCTGIPLPVLGEIK
jgi:predicted AlkP superfamily pyrophosphatase or phosphodiesterase